MPLKRNLTEEAIALEESGKFAEALDRWRAALAAECGPENMARLGRLCLRHGKQAEGEALLRETIRRYPEYGQAYFYLGVYVKDHGDLTEATKLLETSVQLEAWAPAFVVLGSVYRRVEMDSEAREAYERATILDPEDSEAWSGLALTEATRNAALSIELYRKSIVLDPENNFALRELGRMLWERGDHAAAEDPIRAALRVDERDVWAHDYLGLVLVATHRDGEAEREFRAAIALWPDVPLFHCHLGEVLVRLDREREGERSFKDALALDVSYYLANLRMGQLLRDQGTFAQARVYLQRALHANPSDRRAREALASLPPETSYEMPTSSGSDGA